MSSLQFVNTPPPLDKVDKVTYKLKQDTPPQVKPSIVESQMELTSTPEQNITKNIEPSTTESKMELTETPNQQTTTETKIAPLIFGIFLILGWFPLFIITEKNNKQNRDEFNLLEEALNSKEVKITDNDTITGTGTGIDISTLQNELLETELTKIGTTNFIYIYVEYKTAELDSNNKTIIKNQEPIILQNITKPTDITKENLEFLAKQNHVATKTVKDNGINHTFTIFAIENNKQIFKIEGLKQFNLNDEFGEEFQIFDYEFGDSADKVKQSILNRKKTTKFIKKWLIRTGGLLMLFGGFYLLKLPILGVMNSSTTLTNPFLLTMLSPFVYLFGDIIEILSNKLGLLPLIVITLLLTLTIYYFINKPLVGGILLTLLIGVIFYFKIKNEKS